MIIGGGMAYTFLKSLQVMEVSECVWIALVNPTVRLSSDVEKHPTHQWVMFGKWVSNLLLWVKYL